MRLVIDTNIWVSGLLWRGMPWRLLRLAEAGDVELCMAPSMLAELAKVLAYERLQPRLEQLELTLTELIGYTMNLVTFFEGNCSPCRGKDPKGLCSIRISIGSLEFRALANSFGDGKDL